MAITKQQWSAIQKTLKELHCSVKFRLQTGEELTVSKHLVAENKLALIVWIDGKRNEGWGWPDCNVFRPIVQAVWNRKTYKPGASFIRRMSKDKAGRAYLKRKENSHLHALKEYWSCAFPTAAALVRQLSKIKGIELLEGVSDEE